MRRPSARPVPARVPVSLRFLEVAVDNDIVKPGQELAVDFTIGANPSFGNRYHVSCFVNNEDGMVIAQCDSRVRDFWLDPATDNSGRLTVRAPWLKPGAYTVDLFIHTGGREADIWEQALHFQVLPIPPYEFATTPDGTDHGVVFPDFDYRLG